MKEHKSVWMLLARSVVYKVLGIIALMGAVQTALFYRTMQTIFHDHVMGERTAALESVIWESGVSWVFRAALVLTALVVASVGWEMSGKLGYTLRRLRVSEKWVLLWHGLTGVCCFALVWLCEILIMVGLGSWFVSAAQPDMVSGQSLFIAFYRSTFLHNILPLEDMWRWGRNLVAVLALGFVCADVPFRQRRGHMSGAVMAVVLMLLCQMFFLAEIEPLVDGYSMIGCLCMSIPVIYDFVLREKEGEQDEENVLEWDGEEV